MSSVLSVYLSEEGADPERLDALSRYLRSELIELDVENVTALPAGPPPPGTRSGTLAVIGGLLVNLGDVADGLTSVVSALRAWLNRGEQAGRTVRLELDDDVLEISQPSAAQTEKLIELFISRHQP